jgi:hypothetical protein
VQPATHALLSSFFFRLFSSPVPFSVFSSVYLSTSILYPCWNKEKKDIRQLFSYSLFDQFHTVEYPSEK